MRAVTATMMSASLVMSFGLGIAFAQTPRESLAAAQRSLTDTMMHLRVLGESTTDDAELRRVRAMAYLSLAHTELQQIRELGVRPLN
jgi:hypothetical protein